MGVGARGRVWEAKEGRRDGVEGEEGVGEEGKGEEGKGGEREERDDRAEEKVSPTGREGGAETRRSRLTLSEGSRTS